MRIVKIATNTRGFFHKWVELMAPFLDLGKTQRKVLAELLYYRYMLKQEVLSDKLLDKLLFDFEMRMKICEVLDIPKRRFDSILSELRTKGMVKNKTISDKVIPDMGAGDKEFVLAFKFKLEDNEGGVYSKKTGKALSKNSTT